MKQVTKQQVLLHALDLMTRGLQVLLKDDHRLNQKLHSPTVHVQQAFSYENENASPKEGFKYCHITFPEHQLARVKYLYNSYAYYSRIENASNNIITLINILILIFIISMNRAIHGHIFKQYIFCRMLIVKPRTS